MRNKAVIRCACVSMGCFLGLVALYLYLIIFNPNPIVSDKTGIRWTYISLTKGIHIAATKNWGGNLVLFNRDIPNKDVMYDLSDRHNVVTEKYWNGIGLYFISMKYIGVKEPDNWTLMISLWWPIVIFGIISMSPVVIKKNKEHPHEACHTSCG